MPYIVFYITECSVDRQNMAYTIEVTKSQFLMLIDIVSPNLQRQQRLERNNVQALST